MGECRLAVHRREQPAPRRQPPGLGAHGVDDLGAVGEVAVRRRLARHGRVDVETIDFGVRRRDERRGRPLPVRADGDGVEALHAIRLGVRATGPVFWPGKIGRCRGVGGSRGGRGLRLRAARAAQQEGNEEGADHLRSRNREWGLPVSIRVSCCPEWHHCRAQTMVVWPQLRAAASHPISVDAGVELRALQRIDKQLNACRAADRRLCNGAAPGTVRCGCRRR
ncbi:MAG: hypothetical protein JWM65_266 [Sphingomonas bacterium]|nr:hypothetical protein [Sphingomonas bacterium]